MRAVCGVYGSGDMPEVLEKIGARVYFVREIHARALNV